MSKATLFVAVATVLLALCGPAGAAGSCGGARQQACISDGAAKGQATEHTYQPGSAGQPGSGGPAHPAPGMAIKGSGVPQNTTVQPPPHPDGYYRSIDRASP